jgi:hypothetical protein
MNNRIVEILQNPDLLVFNDIEILENEISKSPFVQSFRAVQLLATHRFKEEKYASKLSETAAFTTDKKILYQLIHQKEIEKNDVIKEDLNKTDKTENQDIVIEKQPISKVEKLVAIPEMKFQEVEIKQIDLPKNVYIDGELNRILFEGEEDFLNEESESIDLEATQESGKIVMVPKDSSLEDFADATRKFTPETIINEEKINSEGIILDKSIELSFHGIDKNIRVENDLGNEKKSLNLNKTETILEDFSEATREFTTETIIEETKIKSEEEIIESGSELSFHGETEFLPDVKIEIKDEVLPHYVAPNKMSKHEAEMQKLIAEVEAKMKKSSAKKIEKEDDFGNNHSLNFTGISHDEPSEKSIEKVESAEMKIAALEENSTWKPMDFSAKKVSFRNNETLEKIESKILPNEKFEIKDIEVEESKTDFSIKKEEKIEEKETPKTLDKLSSSTEESNVPVFINTWQTWLKLNPETPVLKGNIKQNAIEKFIEKEPKISKLKEESSFTVKEKGDNISHLMTETLANLYLDQKLYSKAQKAFELLIEKNPLKADKFNEKLLRIKELRNQK